MSVISMKQLLEAGVHFGHQTRRWNPKMARYIYTERNESKIAVAQHVANPGCFATCIQLGLLPAAKMGLISQYFTLKTGDLLYTGCPTGCGPVNIDDHLVGYLEDRKVLDFHCK